MTSLLESLNYENSRVFSANLSPDKKLVTLQEECDQYFSVNMDKTKFSKLIGELQAICDQMVSE